MSKEVSLKEKNTLLLWSFFIFNIAVFIFLFFADYFDAFTKDYKTMLSLRSSGILIAPLVLFIVNGLLSSNQKAILVFWRVKYPLPGARAFSIHAPNDPRVNMTNLQTLHGTLPVSERDQNELWYNIYKAHTKDIVLAKSHKDFLLGRDITAVAFLFILLVGIPFLFFGTSPLCWIYLGGLVLQYLLTAVVAQNHGRRFVTNVLAIASVKTPKPAKMSKPSKAKDKKP